MSDTSYAGFTKEQAEAHAAHFDKLYPETRQERYLRDAQRLGWVKLVEVIKYSSDSGVGDAE